MLPDIIQTKSCRCTTAGVSSFEKVALRSLLQPLVRKEGELELSFKSSLGEPSLLSSGAVLPHVERNRQEAEKRMQQEY